MEGFFLKTYFWSLKEERSHQSIENLWKLYSRKRLCIIFGTTFEGNNNKNNIEFNNQSLHICCHFQCSFKKRRSRRFFMALSTSLLNFYLLAKGSEKTAKEISYRWISLLLYPFNFKMKIEMLKWMTTLKFLCKMKYLILMLIECFSLDENYRHVDHILKCIEQSIILIL